MAEKNPQQEYQDLKQAPKEQVPPPEFAEQRLEGLKKTRDWMRSHIESVLSERETDAEVQRDHLASVNRNTTKIYESLVGRKLTEDSGEGIRIEIAVLAHDWGKWEKSAVKSHAKDNLEESAKILASLDLTEEEIAIFHKAVIDGFSREDVAHDIFSAYLFEMAANNELKDFGLSEEDKKDIQTAILSHQFGHYYKKVAEHEGYPEAEVRGIRRKTKLEIRLEQNDLHKLSEKEEEAVRAEDYETALEARKNYNKEYHKTLTEIEPGALLEAALNDGDKLTMAEIGSVDKDGNVEIGGYGKILLINAGLTLRGFQGAPYDMEGCFDSINGSVDGVGKEIVTPHAKQIFAERSAQTKEFMNRLLNSEKHKDLRGEIRRIAEFSTPGAEEDAKQKYVSVMQGLEAVIREEVKDILSS